MKKSNHNKEVLPRVNEQITSIEIRIVGDNIYNRIYSLREALGIAHDLGLDLVQINTKVDPSVCKLFNYKKFLYEKKRRQKKLNKARQSKLIVKEIRFGPQTSDHDYEFKRKSIRNFLEEGFKVKSLVFFKGRSIIYKDQGRILLLRLANDLEDCSHIVKMPSMEGKRMFLILEPKK
jgi:translation initiation factor IF-3